LGRPGTNDLFSDPWPPPQPPQPTPPPPPLPFPSSISFTFVPPPELALRAGWRLGVKVGCFFLCFLFSRIALKSHTVRSLYFPSPPAPAPWPFGLLYPPPTTRSCNHYAVSCFHLEPPPELFRELANPPCFPSPIFCDLADLNSLCFSCMVIASPDASHPPPQDLLSSAASYFLLVASRKAIISRAGFPCGRVLIRCFLSCRPSFYSLLMFQSSSHILKKSSSSSATACSG